MPRFWELDFLRGSACVMMALYHFLLDLQYFGVIAAGLYTGFWGILQKSIGFTFLFLVGIGLTISYNKNRDDFAERMARRGATVFGLGLVVSAITFIAVPGWGIYFGILHLIGVSIILATPFVGKKRLSLAAGIALILAPMIYNLRGFGITELVWLGLSSPFRTLDFYPVIPWFGCVLLGIAAGNHFYENGKREFKIPAAQGKLFGLTQAFGKNALLFYFAHQLVLLPLAYLVSQVI